MTQLADADVAESEKILRACVHCGFCLATCPTYELLGDELDSPRGRIYLIKGMLEDDRPASAKVAKHLDRCLSCLSCMTTCPSGVHYMHLVDHARRHVAETFTRPLGDRLLRRLLGLVLPRPALFRLALGFGVRLGKPLARLMPGRLPALLAMAPAAVPAASSGDRPRVFPAEGARRARVALLTGCVQQVLAPRINEATVRLLTRHGVEVVVVKGAGCCGALNHHLGQAAPALAAARANVAAWTGALARDGLDAIVINASGCGTTVKDYGFMLRGDPELAGPAARVSALAKDVTEFIHELGLAEPAIATGQTVAYQAACSMRHGQQIRVQPKALLSRAGFAVREVPEDHLCCGSAGTYNILQPELATRLRERKIRHIESVQPDLIASGNIGCMIQIAAGTDIPVIHTVELLDWATGGPRPAVLAGSETTPSSLGNTPVIAS